VAACAPGSAPTADREFEAGGTSGSTTLMNAWDTGRVPSEPVTLAAVHDATTVHLLRHGEVRNPQGILYGRLPDFHLSGSGRAMAQGVADFFCGIGGGTSAGQGTGRSPGDGTGHSTADHHQKIDIAYLAASSLDRAQETAAPLAAASGVTVRTDDRLIEAGNTFEGTRFDSHAMRNPANWRKLRNPARPSWGEPYLEIAHRMLGALYAAEQAARGRVAVLVSHQLPIWTLRRFLQGQRLWHNPAKRECNLASLTSVHFAGGVISSISYSEPVGHLAAEGSPTASAVAASAVQENAVEARATETGQGRDTTRRGGS